MNILKNLTNGLNPNAEQKKDADTAAAIGDATGASANDVRNLLDKVTNMRFKAAANKVIAENEKAKEKANEKAKEKPNPFELVARTALKTIQQKNLSPEQIAQKRAEVIKAQNAAKDAAEKAEREAQEKKDRDTCGKNTNRLQIMINTRIPGHEKLRYEPSMTIKSELVDKGKNVYVNTFIEFNKDKIYDVKKTTTVKQDPAYSDHSNINNPDVYKQFFEKRRFLELIRRNFKKTEKYLQDVQEKGEEIVETEQYEKNKVITWNKEFKKLEERKNEIEAIQNIEKLPNLVTDLDTLIKNVETNETNKLKNPPGILLDNAALISGLNTRIQTNKENQTQREIKKLTEIFNADQHSRINRENLERAKKNVDNSSLPISKENENNATFLKRLRAEQLKRQDTSKIEILNIDNEMKSLTNKIDGQQEVNEKILKQNIRLTLDVLFTNDNVFYIRENPYTIYGYEWLNEDIDDWSEDAGIRLMNESKIKTEFNAFESGKAKFKKKNLHDDYIKYLNTFWEKYAKYDRYPVFDTLEKFMRDKNKLITDTSKSIKVKDFLYKYTNDDIKKAEADERNPKIESPYFKEQKRIRLNDIRRVQNDRTKLKAIITPIPKNNGRIIKFSADSEEPDYATKEGEDEEDKQLVAEAIQLDKQLKKRELGSSTVIIQDGKPIINKGKEEEDFEFDDADKEILGLEEEEEEEEEEGSNKNKTGGDPPTKEEEEVYGKGLCYYVVEIDLDIYPGKEISSDHKGRLSCGKKKERILRSWQKLTGRPEGNRPNLDIKKIKYYRNLNVNRDMKAGSQNARTKYKKNRFTTKIQKRKTTRKKKHYNRRTRNTKRKRTVKRRRS